MEIKDVMQDLEKFVVKLTYLLVRSVCVSEKVVNI